MKQDQRAGPNSTNIQAAVVNITNGLSEGEVREIAVGVWRENMVALSQVARDAADARASELREEILAGLARGEGNADAFQQPEKQLALIDAQRGFAISGDQDLRDALTRAVLNLSKEPERSINAIVLSEAIKILPSLTRRQISAITSAFVVRFVTFNGASSVSQLLEIWEKFVGANAEVPTDGDFRHLEYCGCGRAASLGVLPISELVRRTYPGLVSKGIDIDQLIAAFGEAGAPSNGVMVCLNDPSKYQIAALNEHVLKEKSVGWTEKQRETASSQLMENLMGDEEISVKFTQGSPFGAKLFSEWQPWLQRVELTSVGMAVGHSHAAAIDAGFAPLDIWLR
jgi:hypothetical protein